ncbi:M50 family metallopeptidase [Paenibacillus sp. sgz302251]|uniref:M50 family metallopeptidase n=1 Tax=Paenibacillus sp. sgz302251 TaxID=3414493 RepID=UPI003C799D39
MSWVRMAVILVITAFLTRFIPFSAFFANVNTLVHELAHALVALLLQGSVMHIYLFADQSGVTYTAFSEGWMSIPIALAGYIGASLFAAALFMLFARDRERLGLGIIATAALLALALFVRNGYGMAWCAGFAVLTLFICVLAPNWLRRAYYLLLAFICLVESVISSFVLLYLSVTSPSAAGDAAGLSESTFIPAFLWALLFTIFSLWCAKMALGHLFKR